MSNVNDEFSGQLVGTALSEVGLQVWWDRELSEIWMVKPSATESGQMSQRFVCIQGTPHETVNSLSHFRSDMEHTTGRSGTRLCLNISTTLLERVGMYGDRQGTTRVISDPIVYELALGIVETHSLPNISDYTKRWMVTMFCIQLAETASTSPRPAPRRGMGFEDWQLYKLETALQYLGSCEMSLERFADLCGLSVCHFARLFKLSYGIPFHQYVVQLKLVRACALLTETQVAVSQIALECGFSDQSSFTRRFSAKTGTSPAAWRKASSIPLRGYSPVSGLVGCEENRYASVGRC
jgi:AraC-like DNA-binding protein